MNMSQHVEILATQSNASLNIINALKYQVLSNADRLEDIIKEMVSSGKINLTDDEKTRLSVLVEELVKQPIRRQIGLLNGLHSSLKAAYSLTKEK